MVAIYTCTLCSKMKRSFILYICIILHLLIGHVVSVFPKLNHGLSFHNANSIVRCKMLDVRYISVKCCLVRPSQRNRSAVIVREKGGPAGESAPFPEGSENMQSNPRVSSPSPWLASLLPLITIQNELSPSHKVTTFCFISFTRFCQNSTSYSVALVFLCVC